MRVETPLQLESNRGGLNASGNVIDGNLRAFGGVTITGNTIDGNLQCTGNNPAPTGGNNIVSGNKEDQCSAL
jgi:hypothetical protein